MFMPWEGVEAQRRGVELNAFTLAESGIPYGALQLCCLRLRQGTLLKHLPLCAGYSPVVVATTAFLKCDPACCRQSVCHSQLTVCPPMLELQA